MENDGNARSARQHTKALLEGQPLVMAWTVYWQIVELGTKGNGSAHEADAPGCLSRFDCQQPAPQSRAISKCVASSERDLEGRLDHVLRLFLVEANQSSRAQ